MFIKNALLFSSSLTFPFSLLILCLFSLHVFSVIVLHYTCVISITSLHQPLPWKLTHSCLWGPAEWAEVITVTKSAVALWSNSVFVCVIVYFLPLIVYLFHCNEVVPNIPLKLVSILSDFFFYKSLFCKNGSWHWVIIMSFKSYNDRYMVRTETIYCIYYMASGENDLNDLKLEEKLVFIQKKGLDWK